MNEKFTEVDFCETSVYSPVLFSQKEIDYALDKNNPEFLKQWLIEFIKLNEKHERFCK